MVDQGLPWGGYAGTEEESPKKYTITVADKTYPMSRWREGILYFLFGIWSGNRKFWRDPSIQFGKLKLVLQTQDCRVPQNDDVFVIMGTAPDESVDYYHGNYSLRVGNNRAEVMDALVRFAKDPYLGQVDIRVNDTTRLTFFGKERHSEYGCSVFTYKGKK